MNTATIEMNRIPKSIEMNLSVFVESSEEKNTISLNPNISEEMDQPESISVPPPLPATMLVTPKVTTSKEEVVQIATSTNQVARDVLLAEIRVGKALKPVEKKLHETKEPDMQSLLRAQLDKRCLSFKNDDESINTKKFAANKKAAIEEVKQEKNEKHQPADRSDLFAAIRNGITLNKVMSSQERVLPVQKDLKSTLESSPLLKSFQMNKIEKIWSAIFVAFQIMK